MNCPECKLEINLEYMQFNVGSVDEIYICKACNKKYKKTIVMEDE